MQVGGAEVAFSSKDRYGCDNGYRHQEFGAAAARTIHAAIVDRGSVCRSHHPLGRVDGLLYSSDNPAGESCWKHQIPEDFF